MRVFNKICPACQSTFEAKRRNQLYCSPECRADINNDKLKAKFQSIKTLEKQKDVGNQYMNAYLSAIRVVQIDFDNDLKNDTIMFEGRKFERLSYDTDALRDLGIRLDSNASQGNKRTAIFLPQKGLLCFLQYDSYYSDGVTYRLAVKKK
jgi:hypothetical protein